jgi:hypothetical protein
MFVYYLPGVGEFAQESCWGAGVEEAVRHPITKCESMMYL